MPAPWPVDPPPTSRCRRLPQRTPSQSRGTSGGLAASSTRRISVLAGSRGPRFAVRSLLLVAAAALLCAAPAAEGNLLHPLSIHLESNQVDCYHDELLAGDVWAVSFEVRPRRVGVPTLTGCFGGPAGPPASDASPSRNSNPRSLRRCPHAPRAAGGGGIQVPGEGGGDRPRLGPAYVALKDAFLYVNTTESGQADIVARAGGEHKLCFHNTASFNLIVNPHKEAAKADPAHGKPTVYTSMEQSVVNLREASAQLAQEMDTYGLR
ncbi:MAG: hypothetical protein BJ554DRAFT_4641 [Olpidium bornovanus]|uniref:GOLD domain-containing protein n=1 Tax=Olpidium bornovanus TaxID=278681 RepID=A0A8H8DLC7_9FUNG|nr:MAG: hypothetical protein BJ554DRAFT_4641 [Olpidium bornovanus]